MHTADWHLGRTFNGISLLADQRQVLMNEVLPMLKAEGVNLLIIAGDIYDRSVAPVETVELFNEVLTKLVEQKIKVVYIAGNHDSGGRIHFGSDLLASAGVFARGVFSPDMTPIAFDDEYGPVYVQLYPYLEPAALQKYYPTDKPLSFNEANQYAVTTGRNLIPNGARSIAVAHAFIASCDPSGSERNLSVGGADCVDPSAFKAFNYTALGHLHNSQKAGGANIRYSGSLLKYSFAEIGQKKGVLIGDMAKDGSVTTEFKAITMPHDMIRVEGSFTDILNNRELYPPTDDFVQVALNDRGSVLDAANRLRQIYPNVMEVLFPQLTNDVNANSTVSGQEMLQLSINDMFAYYYESITEHKLNALQTAVIDECVKEIYQEDE